MKRANILTLLLGICLWGLPATARAADADDRIIVSDQPIKPSPEDYKKLLPEECNRATKPEEKDDQGPPLVLEAYDLGDLLFEAPSPSKQVDELGDGRTVDDTNLKFSFSQPFGVHAFPGPDNVKRDVPRSSISSAKSDAYTQLTEAIAQLISPQDWDQVGGQSSLLVLGDLLLVRTNKENHRKIASLLDVVRQRAAARKIVSVEVHWLWLSEEELHRLTPVSAEKEDGRLAAHLTVDDAAWNRLSQQRAKEENDVRPGYQAIVACLNGQTVVVAAGRQSRFMVHPTKAYLVS